MELQGWAAPLGRHWRLVRWVPVVLAGVVLLLLQSQMYTGEERTVTTVLMFVALAQSWNLIGGFTGYASFGQVVFFGIGGYLTAAMMVHLKIGFWPAMLIGGLFAGLFGALLGMPLLRLKGHYFAIATLGVAEGLREVVINLPRITGGGAGITIPVVGADAPTRWLGEDAFYLLFGGLAIAALVVSMLVSRSRFGFALRAIHQDEDAAAALGINTTRVKVLTFALSGLIAGLVGSAYAFQQQVIYPQRLFDVDITVMMVVMTVIGGAGTVIGPVIGAVLLQLVSEWLRQTYTNVHTFMLGVIIVVFVVFLPQGLVNYLREARRSGDYSLLANVRRHRL